MTVAQYLRNGLAMAPRAIEILHIAHSNGFLNESEQYTLASWLRETNRFAEMIPIMEPLVKHHPDSMLYRIALMAAGRRLMRPTPGLRRQPLAAAPGAPRVDRRTQ